MGYPFQYSWASLVAQSENLPAVQETWVRSLGWEDPLEEGMAAHSSILAWRTPWTEEPDGLQPMGSQRVRHDQATRQQHLLMDTWVSSIFWLLWILLLWKWVYKYDFETQVSVLLGVYPEMQLLGNIVTEFLIFWEVAKLFPVTTCTVLHSHPQHIGVSVALHSCQLFFVCFFGNSPYLWDTFDHLSLCLVNTD